MKKNLIKLSLLILSVFVTTNITYAGDTLKNFYGYEIKNINIRELGTAVRNDVSAYQGPVKTVPIENVKNAYIYSDNNSTYFLRVYPANTNTNIFVVSNEKYDVNNNELTMFFNKYGYKYDKLKDKAALEEYKFDFYKLAREKKLGTFYISPDLVKPLKTGMAKLNNKFAKNNKKTSVIPYSIDSSPIDLTCVDTMSYFDNDAQIGMVQREYRLKEKSNKYVHAFEYIINNKNTSTASVTVTSERLAGLKDVTTEAFVDLDRLDLVDTVCTFPPVLVCTGGLSIVGSVPNFLRLARITKEASRYAHALPQDYKLRPQGTMRILVLKYKDNPKPLNFNFKFNDQTYNITF